ncbi:MAG: M50 family metallopeptidase [archaeon]
MFFSINEIIDVFIMTFAIGFIFKDVFRYRPKVEVITPEYYLKKRPLFSMNDFWFAAAVVAPSIILHEFGHKFFAIANGMSATFEAAYFWLGLGIILKLAGFGFVFLVPAYTSIGGGGTALQMAGVAFAGPLVNLLFWLGAKILMKKVKLKRTAYHIVFLTSRINMFLFIFNMLPIPFFDGWNVFKYLFSAIF